MSSARSSLSAGGHSARAIALLAYRPPGWIIPDVPLFSPSPRLPSLLPAPSLLRYLTASRGLITRFVGADDSDDDDG